MFLLRIFCKIDDDDVIKIYFITVDNQIRTIYK